MAGLLVHWQFEIFGALPVRVERICLDDALGSHMHWHVNSTRACESDKIPVQPTVRSQPAQQKPHAQTHAPAPHRRPCVLG